MCFRCSQFSVSACVRVSQQHVIFTKEIWLKSKSITHSHTCTVWNFSIWIFFLSFCHFIFSISKFNLEFLSFVCVCFFCLSTVWFQYFTSFMAPPYYILYRITEYTLFFSNIFLLILLLCECEYNSQESDLCRAVIESNWNLILTIEINEVQKKWQSTWRYVYGEEIKCRERENNTMVTFEKWIEKEEDTIEKEPLQMVHGVLVYLMKCIHLYTHIYFSTLVVCLFVSCVSLCFHCGVVLFCLSHCSISHSFNVIMPGGFYSIFFLFFFILFVLSPLHIIYFLYTFRTKTLVLASKHIWCDTTKYK